MERWARWSRTFSMMTTTMTTTGRIIIIITIIIIMVVVAVVVVGDPRVLDMEVANLDMAAADLDMEVARNIIDGKSRTDEGYTYTCIKVYMSPGARFYFHVLGR